MGREVMDQKASLKNKEIRSARSMPIEWGLQALLSLKVESAMLLMKLKMLSLGVLSTQ